MELVSGRALHDYNVTYRLKRHMAVVTYIIAGTCGFVNPQLAPTQGKDAKTVKPSAFLPLPSRSPHL